jgi:hypothetical protein
MTRQEMEQVCREQNDRKARERGEARQSGAPCDVETMLAFGGIPYCRTHGVMGECPYGKRS